MHSHREPRIIGDPAPEYSESTASAADSPHLSLSEVLSSLSYALDVTEGHRVGHTLGSAIIGMRFADALGLDLDTRTALYYTLLLKDTGCSSNAARMTALFGTDDQVAKHRMKLVDWHQRLPLALRTAATAGLGGSIMTRARYFLHIAQTPHVTRDLIQIRCERGADIVLQLGFPPATAEAIRCLDEHWDGGGYPNGQQGQAIPLLARIANLAQMVQLFYAAYGRDAALRMAHRRRGTWFDPALVQMLHSWKNDSIWWKQLLSPDVLPLVVAAEPGENSRLLDEDGLDQIARAFAGIIDAKTPFTFQHSTRVAEFARGIAAQLGLDATEQRRLYRAGLLHDIGKLGVSNRILDKDGPLTLGERREVEQHPAYTWEILSRVRAFAGFARLAALHHEKIDGSGYPWKLQGSELDLPARILAVADMYEAMTADRPYRAGLSNEQALALIRYDAGTRVCNDAFCGLEALLSAGRIDVAVYPGVVSADLSLHPTQDRPGQHVQLPAMPSQPLLSSI